MDLGYQSVHPDVVRNTAAVATALRDCGATVNEVSLGWNASVRDAAAHGLLFGMGRILERIVAGRCESVNDYTLDMIDTGARVTSEAYWEHYSTMGRMDRALQDVLAHHDVLLCPTLAITEIPAEGGLKPLDDLWKGTMTYPFNMLSRHPVLAVPSGLASNGVPTGVQIVGRRFEDDRVLQVGGKLEEVLQWSRRRPPCP
jgi:Asp-tRNA(Asn)/Glu-tRNA(Gln) amidotransferase A subunit family amidase